jgi:hypothetical protein
MLLVKDAWPTVPGPEEPSPLPPQP